MSKEKNCPVGRWWAAFMVVAASLAAAGCDEPPKGPEPPVDELPADLDPVYGDGHWSKAQRGIAIDEEDMAVIRPDESTVGISTARLKDDFGLLVLNRPYLENRSEPCTRPDRAAELRPRARAEAFIAELAGAGVEFDRIAVNVDLLSPSRTSILHHCFEVGDPAPRFGERQHREAVVAAFEELADLPGLAYVTVGLDLNRYYHLKDEAGRPLADDYSNLALLYRDVYRAIKAVAPDVKVGPGMSWATFRSQTVEAIAEEYGLDPEVDTVEAVYRAWLRTVAPFVCAEDEKPGEFACKGEVLADFVAFTMIPFPSEPPFRGRPDPEDEALQAVLDHYRHVPLVAAGLPVVLPQVDWPVTSASSGSQKKPFLETLKRALSHVDVEWAAWRRLSDLPTSPPESNPCAIFTQPSDPALAHLVHGADYCASGLISESGKRREVLDVLTTDPAPPAEGG